jgi:hypothetical protein
MTPGFVMAGEGGEEILYWTESDPRETIVRPTALQERPKIRSFRLASIPTNPVEACRCDKCRLVVFEYAEPSD